MKNYGVYTFNEARKKNFLEEETSCQFWDTDKWAPIILLTEYLPIIKHNDLSLGGRTLEPEHKSIGSDAAVEPVSFKGEKKKTLETFYFDVEKRRQTRRAQSWSQEGLHLTDKMLQNLFLSLQTLSGMDSESLRPKDKGGGAKMHTSTRQAGKTVQRFKTRWSIFFLGVAAAVDFFFVKQKNMPQSRGYYCTVCGRLYVRV